MDKYFDLIYYSLSVLILSGLGFSLVAGIYIHRRSITQSIRSISLGISLAATGTAIVLLSGLAADFLLKSSSYFQQVRFAAYYTGFALFTAGLIAAARSTQEPDDPPQRSMVLNHSGLIMWLVYLIPLVIAIFYLVNKSTLRYNSSGVQVQRPVYFLPMLTIALAGAVFMVIAALASESEIRPPLIWMGLFSGFSFIGVLKEALIIPDLGDPLVNLLVAFVPFTLGALCLSMAAWKILNLREQVTRDVHEQAAKVR